MLKMTKSGNATILVVGGIFLLAIAGFVIFNQLGNNTTPPSATDIKNEIIVEEDKIKDEEQMEDDSMMGDEKMEGNFSRYIEHNEGVVEASATMRRVLFFYANWCPTCRPVDVELQQKVAEIPSDVVIIRVNYNDTQTDSAEKALAKKYNVTYQHTFVQIDENGDAVTVWNGGNLAELLAKIK